MTTQFHIVEKPRILSVLLNTSVEPFPDAENQTKPDMSRAAWKGYVIV
jgi:hypothetical protein